MVDIDISDISNDNISGASNLTSKSLSAISLFLQNSGSMPPDELLAGLEQLCVQIVNSQPFMASIRNICGSLLSEARNLLEHEQQSEKLCAGLKRRLLVKEDKARSMLRILGSIGSGLIKPNMRIMTYSGSGSVMSVLSAASESGVPFSVILSEARPMREGIQFAEKLSALNIPATVVTDIHLPGFMNEVDCLILGADWISETQFTNKTGSRILIEYATKQKIPVYIAASTDKILAQKYYPDKPDRQNPDEILKSVSKNITVINQYFEQIPLSDELTFITEEGLFMKDEIVIAAGKTYSLT